MLDHGVLRVLCGVTLAACAGLAAGVTPAFAQGGWTEHAIISINVGTQLDTRRLSESISLEKHVEQAPVTAKMPNKAITFFDLGTTVRIAGNLGAAVVLSYLSDTGTADVTAQIPHPFFFNRPRPISGQAQNVQHNELTIHTNAAYVIASRQLNLVLSGGASFFRVEQDFVTDIAFTESYPFDTAAFNSATLTRASARETGYNVAADVTWKIARSFGVGGSVRFSRAEVPYTANGLDFGTIEAGGLQAGGGLRLMF